MSDKQEQEPEFSAVNYPVYDSIIRDRLNEAYASAVEGSPRFRFMPGVDDEYDGDRDGEEDSE